MFILKWFDLYTCDMIPLLCINQSSLLDHQKEHSVSLSLSLSLSLSRVVAIVYVDGFSSIIEE